MAHSSFRPALLVVATGPGRDRQKRQGAVDVSSKPRDALLMWPPGSRRHGA
jgi:hypothetical protein